MLGQRWSSYMILFEGKSNNQSLRYRVFQASLWTFAGYGLSQAIRFGANLLLTRLLAPEMFGLMTIATVVLIGLAQFSDFGLKSSVIQSARGSDPKFLNTIWVAQIFRGALLACLGLSIAGLLEFCRATGLVSTESVYGDPRLPGVLAALSSTAVISGFASTKVAEAGRNLALARITTVEVAAQLSGLMVSFGWLVFDRSIWALVAGNIFTASFSTIMGHAILPGVGNRFAWERKAFLEILNFGKWMLLSTVLWFLATNGDRLLLAHFVDPTVLGSYSIAFGLISVLDQALNRVAYSVAFPAFSEINERRPRDFPTVYYRMHTIFAGGACLLAGMLMTCGRSIVAALYDYRYADAGWMLEIAAITLLIVPLQLANFAFIAKGRPQINSLISGARAVLLFVAMPAGFGWFGVHGALWGLGLSQLVCIPLVFVYSRNLGFFSLSREALSFAFAGFGAGLGLLFRLAM